MTILDQIRTKIRRLTGRLTPQKITDTQIDDYINTFYIYDMPETLRLVTQQTTFEFMTTENVDTYDMNTQQVWTGHSYENAVDVYITVNPPVYIAGYQSFWSQSREQFFRTYPALAQISRTTIGNGNKGPYTITFPNTPILQYNVTVGAIDDTGATINVSDTPTDRINGSWLPINSDPSLNTVSGTIDYLTGVATVTFGNAIPAGNEITFTAIPYQPARPLAVLYYNNIFTLRPVPDSNYLVKVNAYKRPTIMFDNVAPSNDQPELKQWWQYIAYGASRKIFQDSQDPEGEAAIIPEFNRQERMVLRRTIIERTQQRVSTIYTEMTSFPYGNNQNQF